MRPSGKQGEGGPYIVSDFPHPNRNRTVNHVQVLITHMGDPRYCYKIRRASSDQTAVHTRHSHQSGRIRDFGYLTSRRSLTYQLDDRHSIAYLAQLTQPYRI